MLDNKKVSEITNLIHSKKISVKEVVEYYLKRIEKYNSKLNAIVLLRETEKILDEANIDIILVEILHQMFLQEMKLLFQLHWMK